MTKAVVPADYADFLTDLKERIRSARITAARAANRELILLYWDIGRGIVEKQQAARWGDSVVERLASDLRAEFPDMRGFSRDNLWRMRRFYEEYTSPEFLAQTVPELTSEGGTEFLAQAVPEIGEPGAPSSLKGKLGILEQAVQESELWRQLVAKIPWGHHIELINKVKDSAAHRSGSSCAPKRTTSRSNTHSRPKRIPSAWPSISSSRVCPPNTKENSPRPGNSPTPSAAHCQHLKKTTESMADLRESIQSALKSIASAPLRESGTNLLSILGYRILSSPSDVSFATPLLLHLPKVAPKRANAPR